MKARIPLLLVAALSLLVIRHWSLSLESLVVSTFVLISLDWLGNFGRFGNLVWSRSFVSACWAQMPVRRWRGCLVVACYKESAQGPAGCLSTQRHRRHCRARRRRWKMYRFSAGSHSNVRLARSLERRPYLELGITLYDLHIFTILSYSHIVHVFQLWHELQFHWLEEQPIEASDGWYMMPLGVPKAIGVGWVVHWTSIICRKIEMWWWSSDWWIDFVLSRSCLTLSRLTEDIQKQCPFIWWRNEAMAAWPFNTATYSMSTPQIYSCCTGERNVLIALHQFN